MNSSLAEIHYLLPEVFRTSFRGARRPLTRVPEVHLKDDITETNLSIDFSAISEYWPRWEIFVPKFSSSALFSVNGPSTLWSQQPIIKKHQNSEKLHRDISFHYLKNMRIFSKVHGRYLSWARIKQMEYETENLLHYPHWSVMLFINSVFYVIFCNKYLSYA